MVPRKQRAATRRNQCWGPSYPGAPHMKQKRAKNWGEGECQIVVHRLLECCKRMSVMWLEEVNTFMDLDIIPRV